MLIESTNIFLQGSLAELFTDFQLLLKISAFLTIVAFVKMHVKHPLLQSILIIFIGWFMLFDQWKLFGGLYFIFVLISLGVSTLIIDIFFVMQGVAPQGAQQPSPVSSGKDLMQRQMQLAAARQPRMPPIGG